MIAKLKENRVFRAYLGGKRIDAMVNGKETDNGRFPEDWMASTVRAFNPGREMIVEGPGQTEDGIPISYYAPNGLPILVKLLDAAERLVIQAHPTKKFAQEAWNSPVGKTECWYMIETDPDAYVYIGFKPGISREKWKDCFAEQNIDGMLSCLHRFSVKPNDCIFVPGGVPHAIGSGCLMLETQEPSDLMVIPERVTPSGNRISDEKMHGGLGFDRMFDCFEYEGLSEADAHKRFFRYPIALDSSFSRVVDGRENGIFSVMTCRAERKAHHKFDEAFAIGVITEGDALMTLNNDACFVKKGDRFLLMDLSGQELSVIPSGKSFSMIFSLPAMQ